MAKKLTFQVLELGNSIPEFGYCLASSGSVITFFRFIYWHRAGCDIDIETGAMHSVRWCTVDKVFYSLQT